MQKKDELLFELIREGDVEAFESLFTTYYPALCMYAHRLLGDIESARDLTQDVFVTLYENRSSLQIKSSAKAYLQRSVHNACLNFLTKSKMHAKHHVQIASQDSSRDEHDSMIRAELEAQIFEEIQKLPQQCRNIFQMNRFEGKKNKDIAAELGISVRTVETQISKALKLLRRNLGHLLPTILLFSSAA
ncbi:MAG: RNA polymerase sigma-70 factor [Bacteroidota bacterium]